MQKMIFIADLFACSTCFRHHYAHHQELESIIQVVAACGIWCPQTGHINFSSTPYRQLENQSTKYHRQQQPDDGHSGARNMLSKQ